MLSHYQQQFEAFHRDSPEKVREWAKQNLEIFLAAGFPTIQEERWKYTNLKALAEIPFVIGSEEDAVARATGEKMSFSSRSQESLSSFVTTFDEQVRRDFETVHPYLGQAVSGKEHPLAALNAAFARDGLVITVGKNESQSIHLDVNSCGSDDDSLLTCRRNIIILAPGAQATVIENCIGAEVERPYWTNIVTEVYLGEQASLRYIKIQNESKKGFHWSAIGVRQQTASQFESYYLALGGKLARQEIEVQFDGPGAHCSLHGIYIGDGDQHLDQQTLIDHAVPHCTSTEVYKGILDDQAQGVFNGQILVRPQAQKTNSSLSNKNILLSRDAVINTKPLLEILANDVKCSHGATIGRLDEQQIFYLKSRGIDERVAKQMLTMAFADEVLEGLEEEQQKDLEKLIHARMEALHEV